VIKETVGVNPGVWKPDYTTPDREPTGYKAPDHVSGIPVQKEHAEAAQHSGYRAPDHVSNIPIQKEKADPVNAPGYKAPNHVSIFRFSRKRLNLCMRLRTGLLTMSTTSPL